MSSWLNVAELAVIGCPACKRWGRVYLSDLPAGLLAAGQLEPRSTGWRRVMRSRLFPHHTTCRLNPKRWRKRWRRRHPR